MTVERMRGWLASLVVVCLMAVTAQTALGQGTVVTGKVTDEHGAAIGGATVYIGALRLGGTTNTAGDYTITIPDVSARGQSVSATVRFIGYAPQTRSVTLDAGTHTLNFSLKSDPFQLNAVITTGVADSTSQAALTFSVAKVTAAQVNSVPATDPLTALAGKVAAVEVAPGDGGPGTAPAIRIRGSTCLQVGCSSPLIIVDGVITHESISDIDAQDISSIEVLKGAAGASFYGSDAANGVINITTKHGADLAENHIAIQAHAEYGTSGIAHYPTINNGTRDTFNPDGSVILDASGNPVLSSSPFDDNAFPTSGANAFRNQLKVWLKDNAYYNNDVSIGMRRGNTNFNSSFSTDHNGGILPFKQGQYRQNVRLAVDQGVGSKADFSASITYGNQNNDYTAGGAGSFFALYQAPPNIDLKHPFGSATTPADSALYYPVLPSWSDANSRGNPLYGLYTSSEADNRQRFLGSIAGHYRPTDWLRFDANYGTDRLAERQQNYTPRGTLSGNSGQPTQGNLNEQTWNDISWNSQLRGTATKLFKSLLSTTSAAYQLESSWFGYLYAGGGQLNVNGVPSLAAAAQSSVGVNSVTEVEKTVDYMVSQDFDLKDRYMVSALYRRDGSSLFGSQARWSNFYRISGAYRITQDFHIPGFQELKVHVAQGTAGLRPDYSWQYETYNIGNGNFSPATLGNKKLKPAILTETEYGINADFLNRFSAEINYANRRTTDAFLQVPLSLAASGGFNSQWQNAATIGAKTLEGDIQTRLMDREHFTWDLTVTGDHTTQKILYLNRAPFRVSATGAQGQNVFWYQQGEPLGIIYGTRFVRTFQQLIQNPKYASANASDYVVNPLGYLVLASTRGTGAERPITYVDSKGNSSFVIGDVNPKMNYGVTSDMHAGQFTIHANFTGQVGGDVYNFSKQWMVQDLRAGSMSMVGKAQSQKVAENFFTNGLYNGLNPTDYFVESGAYLKLSELSVGYDVPTRILPKLGLGRVAGMRIALLGRNLYTWTKYSGFDPNITSGNDFNYKIDGFAYPPFRTFTGQFEIRF